MIDPYQNTIKQTQKLQNFEKLNTEKYQNGKVIILVYDFAFSLYTCMKISTYNAVT